MKIISIELFLTKIKLKQVFTTSLGARSHTANIFVRVKSDTGLIGWGECGPNPKINGETAETCLLIGQMLGKLLIGQDPRTHAQNMYLMDRAIFGNTSIKSALDIACYDLAAKSEDQPLYRYLGGSIEKKIFTDYTVSVSDQEQMVADALKIKSMGFPSIKVKLGDGQASDVDRIRAIREAVGNEIDMRVDANQGWTIDEAISTLTALNDYNIQYCEEPISRRDDYQLRKVSEHSPIKIMADESLFDHYDARKLIEGDHCAMFNIKLGKSSGLFKAQKIIDEASTKNIEMQIGGFLESRIVVTANVHLAHTHKLIKYFDFDSPLLHSIDPIEGGLTYQKDWEVLLPESPGLGVDVDRHFLKNCEAVLIN